MRSLHLPLFLLFAFVIATAEAADDPTRCRPSVWSLDNQGLQRDGSMFESKATSTRYCLLDGALEMDEFRSLDGEGQVNFRGVSFTYPIGEQEEWRTLWVMVGDPGNTLIVNRRDGDKTVHSGHGFDGLGRFDEEATTTYPAADRYRFEMGRKYELMGKWLRPFNIIDGKRTARSAPDLPAGAAAPLQRLENLLPDGQSEKAGPEGPLFSSYILDGYAYLSIRRGAARNGEIPLILEYAAPTGDAMLLIYEWELGGDALESHRKSKPRDIKDDE